MPRTSQWYDSVSSASGSVLSTAVNVAVRGCFPSVGDVTAILAFGVPEVVLRSELSDRLEVALATVPDAGTNAIIVAHIGTIRNAIGLDDTFEEGDSLIYRPDGSGGFEFVGRIGLYDWPILAEISAGLE